MTATMILKEIQALPAEEKNWLFKNLDHGNGHEKTSEAELLQIIENLGNKMQTSLTAQEIRDARLEGRK